MNVAIIDTGGANLASIKNALLRLGVSVSIVRSPRELARADRIILPGVGHAKFAMDRLQFLGLKEEIQQTQKKVLGICLGMQILFDHLEEGDVPGLGIVPGIVRELKAAPGIRVPNMGWTRLQRTPSTCSLLLEGIEEEAAFYFTHSYACPFVESIRASTLAPFEVSSVLEHRNFFGTQFHPEKSGTAGEKLLANFLEA